MHFVMMSLKEVYIKRVMEMGMVDGIGNKKETGATAKMMFMLLYKHNLDIHRYKNNINEVTC